MSLAVNEVDSALEKLRQLKPNFDRLSEDINEATTRLQIIDEIFINVLGWPKNLIEVEYNIGEAADDNKHKAIYADYVAQTDRNLYVIEAKRKGSYFNLPNTRGTRVYKSSGVIYNAENKSYIDQAKKYMLKIGTPFCVLTNGIQYVIIRRTSAIQEKDTIVFKDIEDIEKNFVIFWNILNPDAEGSTEIDRILKNPNEVRKAPSLNRRVIDRIKNSDKYALVKHSSIIAIENNLIRFFGELTSKSQIDLLKECYCDPSGNYKDFAGGIKRRLESKPIQAIASLTNGEGNFIKKGQFEKQYLENLQKDPGAVYVLLGEVGAGKSTFLEHFYNFELSDLEKSKLFWLRIDFLDFNDSLDKLNEFISNEIIKRIESTEYNNLNLPEWETLQKIYSEEITNHIAGMPPMLKNDEKLFQLEIYQFIQRISSDREFKLKKILEYIKNEVKLNLCFIFDNIDQKPYEEQKDVLLIAHQRANVYGATVITAMRYQSYNKIKNKSPYDALQTYEYKVLPPGTKELLDKRFQAMLKYPQEHFIYEYKNKTIKVPISKFVQVLKNTFEKDPQAQVEKIFEHLAGGNIRKLLRMFRSMITSGNTRLHEILDFIDGISNLDKTYLSYEKVLDGLTRDNNKYYISEDSSIINLFKFHADGFYSHFLSIYILKYLDSKLIYNDGAQGYVELDEILEVFSMVITDMSNLEEVLLPLLENFLINSDVGERDQIAGTNAIQISEAGLYYLKYLLPDWQYVFHMMIDTPIRENIYFNEIWNTFSKIDTTHNKKAKEALSYKCVEYFLSYLEKVEEEDRKFFGENFRITAVVPALKNDLNASFSNFRR